MNSWKGLFLLTVLMFFLLLGGALFLWNNNKYMDLSQEKNHSDRTMLSSLWHHYKLNYLEADTRRALDRQRGNITTSEGQSYTLLRAVWQDDKETFDAAWEFTKNNLAREEDHLFSWKFGERPDGSYGVLTEEGGYNTATDADSDIALALVFAYERWQQKSYLESALPIISDIWEKEVVMVNGKPYLAASNLEKESEKDYIVVNPSYFSPYAYRIFSTLDASHDWQRLVDTSYEVLNESMNAPLDTEKSAGLVPDWVFVTKESGVLRVPTDVGLTTDFGYDALRAPFRIALDWQWYQDPRAKSTLERMTFLGQEWKEKQKLMAVYSHAGEPRSEYSSLAFYAGTLGYFQVIDPEAAREIYEQHLAALYEINTFSWKTPQNYYDENIAWFGMALYIDTLTNLAPSLDKKNIK